MALCIRLPLLTVCVLTAGSAVLSAANWPGWRGPEGQGISTESGLPTEWSSSQNVAWKVPLGGRGHSSPIVWGDRVFVTTAVEGDMAPDNKAPTHLLGGKEFVHPDSVGVDKRHTYKVMAIDLASGKTLWERTAYDGPVYDNRHKKGSYASPTPVTDGKRVYAYFGSEGLYAYDFAGKLAWKSDIGDIATIGMGTASSPVLYKDLVILQCDDSGDNKSFLVALDTKTGKERWRTKRDVSVTWATPVLVKAGAQSGTRDELVASGSEWIVGYEPATGKELWRTKGVASNAIHTPLVGHGLVIVTAGYPTKAVIAIKPGGLRGVADSVRRLPVSAGGQRRDHVSGREDGRGEIRRWPPAEAGALHGVAGRVRRQGADDQRKRRHVRDEGRSGARNRADQQHRRDGDGHAGHLAGPHPATHRRTPLLHQGRRDPQRGEAGGVGLGGGGGGAFFSTAAIAASRAVLSPSEGPWR
jgi:outer membrane protein assembly factor BamB